MSNKIYNISDNDFCNIIKSSHSYSEALRALGLKANGGTSTVLLKQRIKELKCSTNHFNRKTSHAYISYDMKDILIPQSTYKNRSRLKQRLITDGLLEYKCSICGIKDWQGKEIALQLDHINGINNDNRLENLRFLCPNCHSQTDTYAGKNNK